MKKIILIFILAASLILANQESVSYLDELQKRRTEYMYFDNYVVGTKDEMKTKMYQFNSVWDDELNKVYRLLMEVLPEDLKTRLNNEEMTWAKKREDLFHRIVGQRGTYCSKCSDDEIKIVIYGKTAQARTLELARAYDRFLGN